MPITATAVPAHHSTPDEGTAYLLAELHDIDSDLALLRRQNRALTTRRQDLLDEILDAGITEQDGFHLKTTTITRYDIDIDRLRADLPDVFVQIARVSLTDARAKIPSDTLAQYLIPQTTQRYSVRRETTAPLYLPPNLRPREGGGA